jgi:hypothetical protein
MKPQTIAMMIYLELLIMALMMDKMITAVFVIFSGLLVMAMYQYGGDRLRDILRRWLVG